jgi:thioredoxin-dependent peroxiredoxin
MATKKRARGKAMTAAPAAKKAAAKKLVSSRQPARVKPNGAPVKAAPAKVAPKKATPKKAPPAKAKSKGLPAFARVAGAVAQVARVAKAVAKVARRTVEKRAGKPAATAAGGSVDVGSLAPRFSLKDQTGAEVDSSSLAGAPYVLYFYPKDDTSGCTKQACGFRDSFKGFGKAKVRVIGVSPDSVASHERFAKKYGLPFTLLSDPDKELASAYGVWQKKLNYGREYMGIQRSTFLVDEDGKVARVYRNVRVDGHVPAVLEAAQSLG